jgi:hypothetical protein
MQPPGNITEELITLYRPVGLRELALLWDSGFRRFPPRLPHQDYFYPVTNIDYARKIASDWNVKDEASVFCGFVTKFNVSAKFLSRYRPKVVGASIHTEYWIEAEKLDDFNHAIAGTIAVEEGFFGPQFEGYVPANGRLKERIAIQQFVELAKLWQFNSVDFGREVLTNRKAIYLNSWFWAQHDFSKFGIRFEDKLLMFDRLLNTWALNQIEIPWPAEQIKNVLSLSQTAAAGDAAPTSTRRFRNARSRAGGRVDDVTSDEAIDRQDDFRQSLRREASKRPPIVTYLALALLLYAACCLVLLIIGLTRPELWKTGDPIRDSRIAFQLAFLGPIRVVGSTMFGFGLLQLKRWARSRLMFFAGLDLCRGLLAFALAGKSTTAMTITGWLYVAFCFGVILCLTNERVRTAFESTPA